MGSLHAPFAEMASIAKMRLDLLIRNLPDHLRDEAFKVGYELCTTDPDSPDTLGDYSRSAQEIRLFLESLRAHCIEDDLDFERELQVTYLHELGHHLGLREEALEARGL